MSQSHISPVLNLHIICPHCEEQTNQTINHLKLGQEFGPWFCNHCHRAYKGLANGVDTQVIATKDKVRSITRLDLLEYPPSDKPLRFLVQSERIARNGEPADPENSRFFFEEHSCPSNWLRNTVLVSHDGDPDPHGFLRYVRGIDKPDIPDHCAAGDQAMVDLFPELVSQNSIQPDL